MERETLIPLQCELKGFERTQDFVRAANDDEVFSAAIAVSRPHAKPRLRRVQMAGNAYFNSGDNQIDTAKKLNIVSKNGEVDYRMMSRYIRDYVKILWRHCQEITRLHYGERDFVLAKPRTEETRRRLSEVKGGVTNQVKKYAAQGMNNEQIRELTGLSSDQIRHSFVILRREGVVGPSHYEVSRELREFFANPPQDHNLVQQRMNQVTASFIVKNHELFYSVSESLKLLGSTNGYLPIEQHVEDFRQFGLAVAVRESAGGKRTAILKSNVEKILVAKRRNGSLATPLSLADKQLFDSQKTS